MIWEVLMLMECYSIIRADIDGERRIRISEWLQPNIRLAEKK